MLSDDDISRIVNGTVDDLKTALPDASDDDVARLLAAEKGRGDGDARVTAIKAIEAEQAKRAVPPTLAETDAGLAGLAGPGPGEHDPAAHVGEGAGDAAPADAAALDAGDLSMAPAVAEAAQLRTFDASVLNGQPLATLAAMRVIEVAADNRADVLAAIDAEIERLREEAKKLPEVDPSSTVSRVVPTRGALDAIQSGRTELFFVDGQTRLDIPSVNLSAAMFSVQGGRPVLERDVLVAGTVLPARITHAVLIDEDGELAGLCEIPDGLGVGNGREGKFPAGTLRF